MMVVVKTRRIAMIYRRNLVALPLMVAVAALLGARSAVTQQAGQGRVLDEGRAEPQSPRRHLPRITGPLAFTDGGHTTYGDWVADVAVSQASWAPNTKLTIGAVLQLSANHLSGMAKAGITADQVCVLVTAERSFDADGWIRLPSDERMSTLLTPGGLAIEGGVQGAVTNRYGYPFRTPLDEFASIAVGALELITDGQLAHFSIATRLPVDLPPGLYRLRFDFGVKAGGRLLNLNGYAFAVRPFSDQLGTNCYTYSPPIPASGKHVTGR
jgi:hypothetical protein